MTNFTIDNTNGGTWTIQSKDSAAVGRLHDLSFWMEGTTGATALSTPRCGVLTAGTVDNTTYTPAAFSGAPTGVGLNFLVQGGAAVVDATPTPRGGYGVQLKTSATVTFDPASTSITRIDRVDLQVLDGAVGENGGTSLTRIIVTTGTTSIAAAPINSTPLYVATIPANTGTLTSGMIQDVRKSAGIRGGVRVLLPGDALSDPGRMVGELRDGTVKGSPSIDAWNPDTEAWLRVADLTGASVRFNTAAGATTAAITTSYTAANGAGVTFVAPASGIVEIAFGGNFIQTTSGAGFLTAQVNSGGTVGSGSVVRAAGDADATQHTAVGSRIAVSRQFFATALSPGVTYNVSLWQRVSSGSGAATQTWVSIKPQLN